MFCPKCNDNNHQGHLCSRCNDLSANDLLPIPGGKYQENDFEIVMTTYNTADIAVIKWILEHEKILYFFKGEHFLSNPRTSLPATLMVHRDQAQLAEELLQNLNPSFICYTV
jgi:hypothetical protein